MSYTIMQAFKTTIEADSTFRTYAQQNLGGEVQIRIGVSAALKNPGIGDLPRVTVNLMRREYGDPYGNTEQDIDHQFMISFQIQEEDATEREQKLDAVETHLVRIIFDNHTLGDAVKNSIVQALEIDDESRLSPLPVRGLIVDVMED